MFECVYFLFYLTGVVTLNTAMGCSKQLIADLRPKIRLSAHEKAPEGIIMPFLTLIELMALKENG